MLITDQLLDAIKINEDRHRVYGDGFRVQAAVTAALYPEGRHLQTQQDFIRAYFLDMIITKLVRYVIALRALGTPHMDSTLDLGNYAHLLHGYDAEVFGAKVKAKDLPKSISIKISEHLTISGPWPCHTFFGRGPCLGPRHICLPCDHLVNAPANFNMVEPCDLCKKKWLDTFPNQVKMNEANFFAWARKTSNGWEICSSDAVGAEKIYRQ